jgi:hypothetical protein
LSRILAGCGREYVEADFWTMHMISNTTQAYFTRCDSGQHPAQALRLADGAGEQSLRLQPIASARGNSRKGIKFDDVRLADLDLDGDLDIITTEENGSYDNWWSTNGLGLVWYENP